MTTQSGKVINHLMREYVQPQLQMLGFSRKSTTWNRQAGVVVDVVNIQASTLNSQGKGSFTTNVGLFLPSVYEVVWGKDPPIVAREVDCVVRTRLSQPSIDGDALFELVANRLVLEQWWDFGKSTSMEELERLGKQVAGTITSQGIPFLERFRSLQVIRDFLIQRCESDRCQPLERIHLAVIEAELGNLSIARSSLLQMSKTLPDWRDRILGVSERLGLS